MDIFLPSELDRIVKEKVESGRYLNETEVVCDALRRMLEQESLTKPPSEVHIKSDTYDQTLYKNIILKNELSARWAVFFDSLGLFWEYSTTSYNIYGNNITLDFNIKRHRCHFLILCPGTAKLNSKVYEELARQTKKDIALIEGYPQKKGYKIYLYQDCKNKAHSDYYENEIAGESHHFGTARRSEETELCLCPDSFEYCANHINLATNSTDDGERQALDGLASGLEEAYEKACKAQF